ncbi:MAG: glycoside hydrolase family 3 protein [Bdellovibrio sp.]
MSKYIREILQILSLSLLLFIFPHFVLASSTSVNDLIEKKIASMSLEEKIGQLFIIGFPQKTLTPDLENFIAHYKPGSFLLFKRNIVSLEQVRKLNTDLYQTSYKQTKLPPLIAIDQEGGAVSRLPIYPAPPNALAIGQTQSPLLAEEIGYQTGLFLREVGFNMNLAPVLDVTDPFGSSFIGVRSFGGDPNLVGELGVAYSQGILRAKVIPTAKHFPGAGNIKADPHLGVVQNTSNIDSLKQIDIKPYEAYVKLGDKIALMLSHFIYPALDSSNEPASFSKKITQDLLRDEMKYRGLIITDDLQMQGSKQLLRPEVAALKALQSGSDIVMLTWSFTDQSKAFDYIKKNVQSGTLPIAAVDQKLKRILTAKVFVNLYRRNPQQPSLQNGMSLSSKEFDELENNVLEKNIKSSLPEKKISKINNSFRRDIASTNSICALSPSKNFLTSFKKTAKRTVKAKLFNGDFNSAAMLSWINKSSCSVSIIAITGPKTATLAKSLNPSLRRKTVVVNLGSPKFFNNPNGYLRVLQLYFNHSNSGNKVAQHLDEILDTTITNASLRF